MTSRARQLADKVAALGRDGQVFAVATVVARRAPVSAHLGDRAIVYADGRMEGFVGGACAREIARTQALESIRAGHARLVSIRPDASEAATSDPEHVVVPMTCVSEGAIDVYIEPFVPARRVVVIGATPVADAVARVAGVLDCDVVRVVDAGELRDVEASAGAEARVLPLAALDEALAVAGTDTAVVVATQGHYDEEALEKVLTHDVPYVGLVASRKRAAAVSSDLQSRGVPRIASIRNPAGLDLGARTPAEVALSILAEIVQQRPAGAVMRESAATSRDVPAVHTPAVSAASSAVDPVCGMQVDIATARHSADVEGTRYYFCCGHCRTRFIADPPQFLRTT